MMASPAPSSPSSPLPVSLLPPLPRRFWIMTIDVAECGTVGFQRRDACVGDLGATVQGDAGECGTGGR